ncbi:hypothetical protein ABBQ38_002614 [Trebouxia sp. C0009 RCD-2024]
MTPAEVREVLKRMWRNNTDILSMLYAVENKHVPRSSKIHTNYEDVYEMFFVQTVPVAPNKFRAPSKLGDQVFEHPQNTLLVAIINANLDLVSYSNKASTEPVDANQAVDRQLDLGRSLQVWLNLQNGVNALFDSTSTSQNLGTQIYNTELEVESSVKEKHNRAGSTSSSTATSQSLIESIINRLLARAGGASPNSLVVCLQGIRQILEKKEGLFRKNMMGKRVNFAARSVISPDPYLASGEIGVPPYFAKRLSFPERVTPWNVRELRQMVMNGPEKHPGAVAVEDEFGRVISLATFNQQVTLPAKHSGGQGVGVWGTGGLGYGGGLKFEIWGTVGLGYRGAGVCQVGYRRAGVCEVGYRGASASIIDLATFKQQVTLPSVQGDTRRESVAKQLMSKASAALSGGGSKGGLPSGNGKIVYRHLQDGDLMLTNRQPTLHKPGLMAHRARVLWGERVIRMHYANCNTFNADFDGDEINLHLPQDNLARAEGYEIVHADEQYIVPTDGKPVRGLIQDHIVSGVWLTKRDTFLTKAEYMQLVYSACSPTRPGLLDAANHLILAPTILKPEPLYTGKQVLTSVLSYYTRGKPPLTFNCPGKTPADYWGKSSGETELLFFKGELLHGCMDKAQYGKFGLVHAVQELYGAKVAGDLISALSRLFTAYLHFGGFTCGLDDLLLIPAAERERFELCETAELRALRASADFADVKMPGEQAEEQECVQREPAVRAALSKMYRSGKNTGVLHDMKCTGAMHPLSSDVIKVCLPKGQIKPFPHNCLSLMTVTGAKGSLVNFSQISCLLGQQELEGRRVPRMASGKTLPCFSPFDAGARSGGFIGDRFLTGLRPQEYYFHCMAGRDGLVDTTVKTSRSGYLQRCLVKNLESLKVNYDHTVRDDCDGSIVQFAYGEDGIDVMNVSYLREFGFLSRNAERFAQQLNLQQALQATGLSQWEEEARALTRKRQKQLIKAAKAKKTLPVKGGVLPVGGRYPLTCLGVTSEAFGDALGEYVRSNPDSSLKPGTKKKRKSGSLGSETLLDPESQEGFQRLMELKYMRSLAAPGEAVGVIAAQSVGEPSTQMTLNTFHMAGRGEANVTLGIPRLRELFMTAAQTIKTPVMTLPIRQGCGHPQAVELANRLRRIRFAEVLQGLSIEEHVAVPSQQTAFGRGRLFRLRLQFFPEHLYPQEAGITFADVAEVFKTNFMLKLQTAVKQELKKANAAAAVTQMSVAGMGGEEQGAAARGTPDSDGTGTAARKSEKEEEDENVEENEEYQEGKLRFAGGRKEEATYDAGDEEDKQIAADVRREAERQGGEEEAKCGLQQDEETPEGTPSPDTDHASSRPSQTPTPTPTPEPSSSTQQKKGGDKATAAAIEASNQVDADDYACEAEIVIPLDTPTLLMQEIAERVAVATMIRDTPGIERCYIVEADATGPAKVQTDGINFTGVWAHTDLIDVDNITTNDVGTTLRIYGVEAARATLMREVRAVFGAYGIGVDPRHLSLIADFMTHMGGYRACNRMGIESSTSTFLKISFETAAHFLTDATMKGTTDDLTSPASRLVVGRVVEMGTGCFSLEQNLDFGDLA